MAVADGGGYSGSAPKKPKQKKSTPITPTTSGFKSYSTHESAVSTSKQAYSPRTGSSGASSYEYAPKAPTKSLGSSSVAPIRSVQQVRPSGPAWSPSYLKPNPALRNTLLQTAQTIGDEEEVLRFFGNLMTDRYDTYLNRVENRYARQKDDYQNELEQVLALAREGVDVDLPDAPDVPGLGKGQGAKGLIRTMNDVLSLAQNEDEAEQITRFYRYELERVVRLQKENRQHRESLETLTNRYDNLVQTAEYKRALKDGKTPEEAAAKVGAVSPLTQFFRAIGGDGVFREDPGIRERRTRFVPDGKIDKDKNPLAGIFNDGKEDPSAGDKTEALMGGVIGTLLGDKAKGKFEDMTNSAVGDALSSVGDETEDGLYWTIDKLSRPLYGAANATNQYFNENDEPSKGLTDSDNPIAKMLGFATGKALFGQSYLDSLDNLDAGSVGRIAGEFGQGFSGKDKTTFGHVISEQAQRDGRNTYHDSSKFQIFGGLGADLLFDPLNFVGVGLVKKPLDGLRVLGKTADQTENLKTISSQLANTINKNEASRAAKYPGSIDNKPLDPDTVLKMLTGGLSKKPRSAAQRKETLDVVQLNVEALQTRLRATADSVDDSRLVRLEDAAEAVRAQRDAVLSDFEVETLLSDLSRDLKIDIRAGNRPKQDLIEFENSISSIAVASKLGAALEYNRGLNKVAESLNFGTSRVDKWAAGDTEWVGKAGAHKQDQVVDVDLKTGTSIDGRNSDQVLSRERRVGVKDAENVGGRVVRTPRENMERELTALAERGDRKAHEALRKKITNALDEVGVKGETIQDSLKLHEDPRISDDFLKRDLVRESWKLVRDKEGGKFNELTSSIKNMQARVNTIKQSKPNSNKLKTVKSLETVIARKMRQRDAMQARAIVELIRAEVEQGGKLYGDMGRVNEITSRLKEISNRKNTSGEVFFRSETDESLLKNNPRAYHLKLQEEENLLKAELKELEGTLPDSPRQNLSSVPVGLLDGEVTASKLADLIQYDKFDGVYTPKKTGNPEHDEWLSRVANFAQDNHDKLWDKIYKPGYQRLRDEAKAKGTEIDRKAKNALIAKASQEASEANFKSISTLIKQGKLNRATYDTSVNFKPVVYRGDNAHVLNALRDAWNGEFNHVLEKAKNAQEARKVLDRRLAEDAIMRVAEMAVSPIRTQLSLQVLGKDLSIPGSQVLFKSAEVAGGLPVIKQTRQVFADMFVSPASQLTPEGQLARNRALSNTPNIIEHHILKLRSTLGTIPETERVAGFKNFLQGHNAYVGEDEVQTAIHSAFEDLLPAFNNGRIETPGMPPLRVNEINRFLSPEFKLNENYINKNGIDTTQKLIKAVRSGKNDDGRIPKSLKDPYQISWNLRVAVEQAAARKALQHSIRETFGVKRLPGEAGHIIDKLKDKGWRSVPEIENSVDESTYLFPPESAADIKRLVQMMEPGNLNDISRLVDRMTGYWKTATTVYNPGYWTRNAVGEVMSSWFAGLTDPRWYGRAMNTIKYARQDGKELESLKSQFPMLNNMPSESVKGSEVVIKKTRGNLRWTNESVWVAYNDQGLKTGFINTEFDSGYSAAGSAVRGYGPTQKLAQGHQKMRSAGEWYEDYFRMAHFQYALGKSKAKTAKAAAEEAAREVRKYHFDYTDFTNFEKTVMLRAFPFYKWTRKSLPLMTTMLFTKPGKVMAYPKVMNAISNSLSSKDIEADENGFAPNYEGIVPGWIQDLWAYKIAENDDEDSESYFNLATPQMDTYKVLNNPGGSAYGLLNPLIKAPLEQAMGRTLGQEAGAIGFGENNSFNYELNDMGDRIKHLLRQTPQGNFAQKLPGDETNEDWISFFSGFGIYENNNTRRAAELQRLEEKGDIPEGTSAAFAKEHGLFNKKSKSDNPNSVHDVFSALMGGTSLPAAAAAVGQRADRKNGQGGAVRPKRTKYGSDIDQTIEQLKNHKEPYLTGFKYLEDPLPGNLTSHDMTSDFGPRTHPVTGGSSNHTGTDFGRSAGTPIIAPANGVVEQTNPENGAWGNQILIGHGNGKQTMYAHLSEFKVNPGDKVKKGDVIGFVGSTGLSTGPHLHWETWVDGNPVDPMTFLGGS